MKEIIMISLEATKHKLNAN